MGEGSRINPTPLRAHSRYEKQRARARVKRFWGYFSGMFWFVVFLELPVVADLTLFLVGKGGGLKAPPPKVFHITLPKSWR